MVEDQNNHIEPTISNVYALTILQRWNDCLDISQKAQAFFLRGEAENELTLDYIARLVTLWRELSPKVKNRTELAPIKERFLSYSKYINYPNTLMVEPDKLFEIEDIIREALDKLAVTKIEKLQ